MSTFQRIGLLLAVATTAFAQGPPSGFGGGSGNPFSSSGGDGSSSSGSSGSGSSGSDSGSGSSSSNPFGSGGFGGNGGNFDASQFENRGRALITAHAVLGTLAFGFFFPVGGILIRLGSFRGLWLVHGLFQVFAYLMYTAAFGIGIWMATNYYTLNAAHPIIGIVLFVLIFFQPILGFAHHIMFKKHSRRVIWSYGHIWLGRIIITLGIINGGLGLQLAKRTRFLAPSQGEIIGYSVAAGVMWLAYVASAIYGEVKRRRSNQYAGPPAYKYHEPMSRQHSDTEPGAPNGVGEYYKNRSRGQRYA